MVRRALKRACQSRAACAATAVVLAVGLLAISPALGGPAFLTVKQAKRIFVAKKTAKATFARKKRVYSKPQADARFLTSPQGDARYLTPARGDARYLRAAGATTLQVPVAAFVPKFDNTTTPSV